MIESRLKKAREHVGLSQQDVAFRLNLGQNQVSRWERGTNIPSAEHIVNLANLYEVTADYLLGLVDSPKGKLKFSDLSEDEQELIHFLRSGLLREAFQALATITDDQEEKEGP